MKRIQLGFCSALLVVILGFGIGDVVCADSITPLSLLDINALPAVATNGNNEFTIAWGYLGLGSIPGILAKRYDSNGEPIDNVGFWVSSPFAAPSIFNYDPDIATDSANNSVVAWCSYVFSSPGQNIQVVYTKVKPASEATRVSEVPKATAISPQQEDATIHLLNIPFSPVVAVDSEDTVAIAWSYYDFESGENGIYLTVVKSDGTAIDPVKVVDNLQESSASNTPTDGTVATEGAIAPSESGVKSLFCYSPSIAFDGEGNIVVTWTATGMMPYVLDGTELPATAIYYSKYDTSGSVVSGYDKQTIAVGFNSVVAVNGSGDMIIAWNTFDVFTLKVRIMAAIYSAQGGALSKPLEVGVRPNYTLANFVDTGNYFLNTGIDIAADPAGNFFVAWGGSNILSNQIYLKEIYMDGSYLSSEIQVSQGFDLNYGPSIATDSLGNIIIAWNKCSLMNLSAGPSSVYARRFDNNLQALGDEFKVNVSY